MAAETELEAGNTQPGGGRYFSLTLFSLVWAILTLTQNCLASPDPVD